MTKEKATLFRKGIVTNNALLFEMVGICPVVAIASSLKLALAVAFITTIELIIIEVFSSYLLKNVKRCYRVLLYAILGFLVNLPFYYLIGTFSTEIKNGLGIFLPLLAVSSIIALHCERFAVINTVKNSFFDALSNSCGYAIVILIVGSVREIVGNGTLWGINSNLPYTCSAMLTPFGGFLVLGFLAAFLKGISNKKYSDEINSAGLDISQIRALHISNLMQLLDVDEDEETVVCMRPSVIDNLKGKRAEKQKDKKPKKEFTVPESIEKSAEQTEKSVKKSGEAVGHKEYADILASLEEYKTQKSTVTESEEKVDLAQTEPKEDGGEDE